VRHLAGRSIPCALGPRISDPEGFQLGLATLPGKDDTECHDTCGGELFRFLLEAGLQLQLQPAAIFSSLIPANVLTGPGRPRSIIPDCAMDVALPSVVTARGMRRSKQRLARRRLLFDVKTIHGDNANYRSAHARDEQSGAVRNREHRVHPDYITHARELDQQYYAGAPYFCRPDSATKGPIQQRIESFTTVRGLVFGQYSEASADVHDLIAAGADAQAQREWQLAGARTQTEMRAYCISRARQRIGVATAQAFARHRLARAVYIGVPRAVVQAQMQAPRPGSQPYAPDPRHSDFFQHQARLF